MSITASVSNYRGASSATLEIDKITLISGINGAGKSSLCQAIGAALTGEPMPIDDENGNSLAKTKAGCLVRSGTAAGSVKVEGPGGTSEILWPSAKLKTVGQPPAASVYAVGLDSIVTMDLKKRIPFLIDYLKAQPTKENLAAAIGTLVPGGTIDKLWDLIQTQGWDATYAQVKEKGAKYKGQWEDVTNANYGIKLATSWLPNGYEPNLEGSSEDTLKACVTDARDSLEAAIAASAVDDSKRQDLEVVAGKLLGRQTALDEAKKPLLEDAELKAKGISQKDAQQLLLGHQNTLAELRSSAPKAGIVPAKLVCPCCNKDLMMENGALSVHTVSGPDQSTIDAHAAKVSEKVKVVNEHLKTVAALDADVIRLGNARQNAVNKWNQGIADASRLVRESTEAAAELAGMAAPSPAVAVASVDQCRNDLAAHELRLSAFTAKRRADSLHAAIEMNQALLKHVAPAGVRADVLTHAIGNFNTGLAGICEVAGWPIVQVEPEFTISFNCIPYFLASKTQQWMTRTVVLIAMAMKEKASAIVIDDAECLVSKVDRNKLFRLIKHTGIPALVAMAFESKDLVPNLSKAGAGDAYWINSQGVAEKI